MRTTFILLGFNRYLTGCLEHMFIAQALPGVRHQSALVSDPYSIQKELRL